jgi:hypothetical protein
MYRTYLVANVCISFSKDFMPERASSIDDCHLSDSSTMAGHSLSRWRTTSRTSAWLRAISLAVLMFSMTTSVLSSNSVLHWNKGACSHKMRDIGSIGRTISQTVFGLLHKSPDCRCIFSTVCAIFNTVSGLLDKFPDCLCIFSSVCAIYKCTDSLVT